MPDHGEHLGQIFYFTHKRANVLQGIKYLVAQLEI